MHSVSKTWILSSEQGPCLTAVEENGRVTLSAGSKLRPDLTLWLTGR